MHSGDLSHTKSWVRSPDTAMTGAAESRAAAAISPCSLHSCFNGVVSHAGNARVAAGLGCCPTALLSRDWVAVNTRCRAQDVVVFRYMSSLYALSKFVRSTNYKHFLSIRSFYHYLIFRSLQIPLSFPVGAILTRKSRNTVGSTCISST